MSGFEKTESDGNKIIYKRAPRVPPIKKSLAIFVASLQGVQVVVELKDDSEICGIVEESDKGMNVVLNCAKHTFSDGRVLDLDVAYINGTSIRYVHFPQTINPTKHLNDYLKITERIKSNSKPHQIKDRVLKRPLSDVDSSATDDDFQSSQSQNSSSDIYLSYGNEN